MLLGGPTANTGRQETVNYLLTKIQPGGMIKTIVGTSITSNYLPSYLALDVKTSYRDFQMAEVSETRPDFPPKLINFWS